MEQSARVRFRDVKPYFHPESLEELRGPYSGNVKLRHSVRWAPGDGTANLDTLGGVRMAYQALLTEGKVADQVAGLNAKKLIEVWPLLNLDPRVRELWESKFPQLVRAGNMS